MRRRFTSRSMEQADADAPQEGTLRAVERKEKLSSIHLLRGILNRVIQLLSPEVPTIVTNTKQVSDSPEAYEDNLGNLA